MRGVFAVPKAVLHGREAVVGILGPWCLGIDGRTEGGELLLAGEVVVLTHGPSRALRCGSAHGGPRTQVRRPVRAAGGLLGLGLQW